MEIVDQETKDRVLTEVSRHLNIREYYDIHELTGEEFTEKCGHWGIGQKNFIEIRFYPETNGLIQLKKLLSRDDEHLILPIDKSRKIFRGEISVIDQLFNDDKKAQVIVADIKFNWILIKNEFNKIIGIGNQIKKRMKKKIQMCFDNERIMYSSTDSKEGEEN